jgi:hypothetical protein
MSHVPYKITVLPEKKKALKAIKHYPCNGIHNNSYHTPSYVSFYNLSHHITDMRCDVMSVPLYIRDHLQHAPGYELN